MTSSITLHVPRVRCIDETGGGFAERFGNDEMYLGAVFVTVSANRSFDVRVVRTREVGANFDDGETVNWNRDLFSFDLGDPSVHPFPKAVVAALVLAEHDAGNGRNDFLEKLAKQFNDSLTKALIDNVITKAAVARRANPDQMKADGGFVVGALKEFAAEELKKLAKALLDEARAIIGDDVFEPVIKKLDLASETQTFNGSGDTPEEIAEFTGHDGKYQVTMFWKYRFSRVVRPLPRPPVLDQVIVSPR